MHLALHFPFADVRRYVPDAPVPAWPLNSRAFVRGFGRAHDRSESNATDRFPAEGPYCDAKRIIRFEPRLRKHSLSNASIIEPYCAHRRLIGDKQGAMRLEIGIGTYADASPRNVDGDALLGVLARTLDLRVTVRATDGPKTMELSRADISVARSYLANTTARGGPAPQRWWVSQGKPLCVVMYDPAKEVASLPRTARQVATVGQTMSASIAHVALEHRGVNLRALLVGVPGDVRRDSAEFGRLRAHLARVHTERECLKEVLRLIDIDRLAIDGDAPSSKRLQDYLQAVFSRLTRETYDGLPQESLARAMEDDYDAITEEQRDRILARLGNARPSVIRDAMAALQTGAGVTVNYFAERTIVSNGETIVGNNNQVVKMAPNSSIHGPIVNGAIRDSFNTIENSSANPELKDALTTLASLVAQMVEKLDADRATEATRDLKTLTDEATSSTPRRKWYDLSASGLLDAAKFVGEFAGNIGTSLAAVTKLLGFGG